MATLAQNIQRAIDDFNSIENAIVQKGVPVPDGTPTSEYGEKILSIETGVDTSGDTVVPSALRDGYTAHDAAGQEITGTIPNYDGGDTVEMTSPDGATLNTAGTYCEGNIEVVPKLQSKTATTGEIVTADDGYVGLESVDTNPAFEAGKKSEYDAFWDSYQNYGNYVDSSALFAGHGWNNETFRPKYSIKLDSPTSTGWSTFYFNGYIGDLVALGEELGIEISFDFSNGAETFREVSFTRLPPVGVRGGFYGGFRGSQKLQTIDKIIIGEKVTSFSYWFFDCPELTNIIIEGKISAGKGTFQDNAFDMSFSHKLSKASIVSIINALDDESTDLNIVLSLAAVNTAFETTAGAADGSTSDEWTALIATKPNWTINLINS